jgi:hypothetical protein
MLSLQRSKDTSQALSVLAGGPKLRLTMPRYSTLYPDRDLDCQQALEDPLHTLLSLAEEAGWSRSESMEALRELIAAHLAMEQENMKADLEIAQAQADISTKH